MTHAYYGPAKVIKLLDLPNQDGFRFIGVDKTGEEHWCIVREDDGKHYMDSNTVVFQDLIGWLPVQERKPLKLEKAE